MRHPRQLLAALQAVYDGATDTEAAALADALEDEGLAVVDLHHDHEVT